MIDESVANRKKLRQRLLAVAVLATLVVAITVLVYYSTLPTIPAVCSQITGQNSYLQSGYSYLCARNDATDGRLRITTHNYHFTQSRNMQWQLNPRQQVPLPDEVFMFLNVTVINTGNGNTTIGGSWNAFLFNGTRLVPTTWFIANMSFPSTYPNQTIPDLNGGLYLPPIAGADLWIIFYVPFAPLDPSNLATAMSYSLRFIEFNEGEYGSTYQGGGGFLCTKTPCINPKIEFVIGL